VIDATGRAARLAPWLDAWRFVFDHLVAIVNPFWGVDTACQGYVMVQATMDGWWYTAPVSGEQMMVMLMTDGDLCGRLDLASPAVWHARLRAAEATHRRLSVATALPGPRVRSALSQRLRRRERHRAWLAVGDAALAVDPISGSGVVRALSTARAAAETALMLLDEPAPGVVEAYEADRDGECTAYLEERARYYGMEQRWWESPFWRRRIRVESPEQARRLL
jgi:2-polyprenyl-6-methoxyphenol hydroxylase-like FAD-dependent oxidoreductase